jgi:carboxyl-terminal processing protease
MRDMTKRKNRAAWSGLLVLTAALAGGVLGFAAPARNGGAKGKSEAETLAAGEKAARILGLMLPRAHLHHRDLDDTMAARALDLYLDSVDFDRTYFLASDADEFRREAERLDDMLKDGDLSFAFRVHDRFLRSVSNRMDFVESLLKKGFDVKDREVYPWKRKDAPRAANEAEWDDLWRRKIKNEYVARLVAVEMAKAEATNAPAAKAAGGGDAKKTPDAKPGGAKAEEPKEGKDLEKNIVHAEGDRKDLHLSPEDFIRKRYKQFRMVLEDSDEETVIDRFLSAFTQAYDPHSEYMTAARTEDFDISMRLSLVGIGAQLSSEDGAAKIERLIPGGPAERDGTLKVGDKIIAVGKGGGETVDTLHWPLYKVVRLIRGEKDTPVTLVYWPSSDVSGATEKTIRLIRQEVKLEEQAAKSKVHEVDGPDGGKHKLGVITLPEFYSDFKAKGGEPRRSAADVRKLLQDLKKEGVDGIALDLRNNGGGSLPDAIEIAGLFVKGGPIVQVRDSRNVQVLSDPDPDQIYDGPLVVLVSRMSASASEIVSAALQDYGRAVVIGDRKTHGKGTVQTLLPLDTRNESLGSFKVTTASFYRIAGGSTQMKGVASDIVVPSFFDAMELGEEFLPHALAWTVIDPAFYAVLVDQVPPLDVLRERSGKRRAANPSFQIRNELVERLGTRMNSETISLNIDERIASAKADKELDDAQRANTPGAGAPDGKDEAKDLVLLEALEVLGDIVRWRSASQAGQAVASQAAR